MNIETKNVVGVGVDRGDTTIEGNTTVGYQALLEEPESHLKLYGLKGDGEDEKAHEPFSCCGIKLKRSAKKRNILTVLYMYFLVMAALGFVNA